MIHERIAPRWSGAVFVIAPGPSLTEDVAAQCRGVPVVAVGDAWRRVPWADVLFATDREWWQTYGGVPEFEGARVSSHSDVPGLADDKRDIAARYGIELVRAEQGEGFRLDGRGINYGDNSGFAAANLALAFGATTVVLVGFDMRAVNGRTHFFGSHPAPLREIADYSRFIPNFERAAELLPANIEIVNATSGSALRCFPFRTLPGATLPAMGGSRTRCASTSCGLV